MCLSIFFAFVIGAYLFVVSLAELVHQSRYKKVTSDTLANHAMVAAGGALKLIFGLILVATHNFWVADWPLLITIVGWFCLLSGLFSLLAPEQYCKACRDYHSKTGSYVLTWVALLVGLYLVWAGFASNQADMMNK